MNWDSGCFGTFTLLENYLYWELADQVIQCRNDYTEISEVVLCIMNPKCDWTNLYSLSLQNNDYWQLLINVA